MSMTNPHRRLGLLAAILWMAASAAAHAATLVSPVRPSASPKRASRLSAPGQEGLDFDANALATLRNVGSDSFTLENFPISPGSTSRLILKRFEVAAPDARITFTAAGGEKSLPLPSVVHFAGHVDGEAASSVYVSAHEDRLVAYLHTSAGPAYVGPDESEVEYVVRSADSPLNAAQVSPSWTCGAEDLPAPLTAMAEPSFQPKLATPETAGFKQGGVRVETDSQLLAKFSDASHMAAYVLTLYGAINVIYDRDLAFHLTVTEVHIGVPAYSGDTLTQLLQLGDWWHANRSVASYPRSHVHFLSGQPVSGGIAWIGVLCSGDFAYNGHYGGAYGLTQVYGTYPLQMWDQDASAHEQGHNSGSVHTHCYVPPIDHCYNQEAGCYSGPVENPGLGGGTIMSYCHLLGWQYMTLKFHDRCINEQMLPEISGAACLTSPVTFADVPTTNPFFHWVETVYQTGVTGGCGGGNFCPNASVTRAQMAVFLLKAKFGSSYVPPACTGVFADVPCPGQFTDWIEKVSNLGITGGCGGSNYCPNDPVTRKQMAPFLLKALYGSSHVPPACTGVFTDVACPGTFTNWIEELYSLGITGGCIASPLQYCPDSVNTRAQMAVFLVKTFGLTW
jgi:hypothetical protein